MSGCRISRRNFKALCHGRKGSAILPVAASSYMLCQRKKKNSMLQPELQRKKSRCLHIPLLEEQWLVCCLSFQNLCQPLFVSKVFKPKTGSATSTCELRCNASHQAPAPTSVAQACIYIYTYTSHQVTIKLRIAQISSIFCKLRFIVSLFISVLRTS